MPDGKNQFLTFKPNIHKSTIRHALQRKDF
uniref:Uncharacterized protein n=1 Tax=Rhizophora mucronata TaxID=61149 RepID=A0A2P2N790_RHIMU